MSDLLTDPFPPQRPLERHQQLETDLFCEHCGYNLHGQKVERDERLGLILCRCPECGRHHPAGHRTTASVLWMSRLAAGALLLWVVVILAVVFFSGLGFAAIQVQRVDLNTTYRTVAADGRTIDSYRNPTLTNNQYQMVYSGTTQPAIGPFRSLRILRTALPTDPYFEQNQRSMKRMLATFAAGIGIPFGILLVVLLWHWRKWNYWWVMLIPFAAATIVWTTVFQSPIYEEIRPWAFQRVVTWATIEAAFIGVGILIGRPLARLFVRLFIPPRPRQFLAFLWEVDGKTPPPIAR